jgi:hypothetical protein
MPTIPFGNRVSHIVEDLDSESGCVHSHDALRHSADIEVSIFKHRSCTDDRTPISCSTIRGVKRSNMVTSSPVSVALLLSALMRISPARLYRFVTFIW